MKGQIPIILSTICLAIQYVNSAFPNVYPKISLHGPKEDSGNPLILTPLIEANKIEEAQNAAKVNYSAFGNVENYAGYFNVDKNFDSNLFFWFFPSENDFENDPVLLWLQGGPGASSLYALFSENGPFVVEENLQVSFRQYSWTKNHSVLYIDNPAGTGFSFTNGGFCQNETKVGEDLYEALQQFFTLFPKLQNNDLFVTGESYAGKYIPAIGYTIYKQNPKSKLQIPLKGLLIGDGLSDPENQISVLDDYLYQIGLIDLNTKKIFKKYEQDAMEKIKAKDFNGAFEDFDILLNGDFHQPTLYANYTGLTNYYNYLTPPEGSESNFAALLNTVEVRRAIHVGNTSYGTQPVEEHLKADVMDTVRPWIEELLNHIRILFFNGQLDVIVAYPLTVNMLQNLNFSSAEEYKTAERKIWNVGNEVAGYYKSAGNLTECLVRNAGHMVPQDQPKHAYDLVFRFVRNIL